MAKGDITKHNEIMEMPFIWFLCYLDFLELTKGGLQQCPLLSMQG